MKTSFENALRADVNSRGFALSEPELNNHAVIAGNGDNLEMRHGAVIIAAITSCTNTSNPSVMIGAGLLAKKAVERGLKVPAYVKTSMAPGSRVVAEYLKDAGLLPYLEKLGFNIVGYGCTTCIGNSGPVPEAIAKAVTDNNIVATAVLSGNRNFEGRISPNVKANYLASPPLVVAYALAGTTDIDLTQEPVGTDENGQSVYLRDLWPSHQEIAEAIASTAKPEVFRRLYSNVRDGNEDWNAIPSDSTLIYHWDDRSTYIQNPPFFENMQLVPNQLHDITGARILGVFGDTITTDHISPAGGIAADSPAGRYLVEHGVQKKDFNQYGTRRGNDRVMVRGTFANIRLKNQMVPGVEGGVTIHYPGGQQMTIFEAAMQYKTEGLPLVIVAGKEYGTGSSRDWAAKGTLLLGVRAVLAESYERIHRSNLVGMGVLPLQFKDGQNAQTLGLSGSEVITIQGINNQMTPKQDVTVHVQRADGTSFTFAMIARLDTPVEVEYYANGGILPAVLRGLLSKEK
jgi:aconitate hydratase